LNAGIKCAVLLALAPGPLVAQGFLDQFSYDGLGFSGIGVDAGVIWSDRLTRESVGSIRIDLGLIAPRIRVMLGAAYYKGQLDPSEVRQFETRLRRVITDPTGDATVSVGNIDWATVATAIDFQYLIPVAGPVVSYLGLGLGMQFWNGSGPAIDGTFVEDALDTIGAAGTGSAGFEVRLNGNLNATAEVRGALTSELRTVSTRFGFMYRFGRGGGTRR